MVLKIMSLFSLFIYLYRPDPWCSGQNRSPYHQKAVGSKPSISREILLMITHFALFQVSVVQYDGHFESDIPQYFRLPLRYSGK